MPVNAQADQATSDGALPSPVMEHDGAQPAAIKRYGHLESQQFADRLNAEIVEFTGGAPQNDDITLVAVKEKVEIESRMAEKRLELIRLVEEEGVPIGEACATLKLSPSSYARIKRLRESVANGETAAPARQPRYARSSLEEEAAILEVVQRDPLLGAKKILTALRAATLCRDELSERGVYDVLKRHGLNTREKRLQMVQTGTDNRMARLAEALQGASPATPMDSEGGGA
jgi:hypothetical protein